MLKNFDNRVKVQSPSGLTDTSTIDLATCTRAAGYRLVSESGIAVGATKIELEIGPDSAGDWLIGEYTRTSSTLLTRTAIVDSSPGGASGVLAAGVKDIFNTMSAARLATIVASVDIAYAAAIPFLTGGEVYMPQTSVAAVIPFTVAANPVKNSRVFLRLIADGTNAPTFTGFKQWGGSMDYDNRAGICNQIQFFYDGYDAWYIISQAVGAVATPAAASGVTMTGPTTSLNGSASSNFTLGVTPAGGTISGTVRITPTSSVGGDTITPAYRDVSNGTPSGTFTVTASSTGARTISATNNAGLTNPATITLTASAAATAPATMAAPVATAGDATASIAYVAPSDGGSAITGYTVTPYIGATAQTPQTFGAGAGPITVTGLTDGTAYTFKIHANNAVGPGTDSPASNSVTPVASASYARLTQLAHVTESGSGPYTYTADATNYNGTTPGPGGVLDKAFASSTDGSVSALMSAGAMICLMTTSTLANYTTAPFGLFAAGGGYSRLTSGAIAPLAGGAFPVMAGDRAGVRRAGSTIYYELWRASDPTTLIAMGNETVPNSAYNVQVMQATGGTVGSFNVSGLV